MAGYYKDKLSGLRLKQCYDIAPARVRQYLEAESDHVVEKIKPGDLVLELGCGYGRLLLPLGQKARWVVGLDNSLASLQMGREFLKSLSNCQLVLADAVQPAFGAGVFDLVACIQNGISAFHVDQGELIRQSLRMTRRGGILLFSSYSPKFWQHRLDWFRLQAEVGLLGEIDEERTGNGIIVCKDGFSATTLDEKGFSALIAGLTVDYKISEVDESSLFCEIYLS